MATQVRALIQPVDPRLSDPRVAADLVSDMLHQRDAQHSSVTPSFKDKVFSFSFIITDVMCLTMWQQMSRAAVDIVVFLIYCGTKRNN